MNDFGAPRSTGFYAGSFENAQKKGSPLYAVAYRRTPTSTVEIIRLDAISDDTAAKESVLVIESLLEHGINYIDIWPVVLYVGSMSKLSVTIHFPTK